MSSTSVFVSGASGYIAQELVKQLIQKNYKVVGTVRSNEKGDSLKENLKAAGLQSENFSYEIVKDIAVEGAFDEALKAHPEVTIFLHTASPFHFNVTDVEKELLLPAINGPYVLIACKAFLVPLIAGSNNSFSTSVTLKWNGDAVCKKIVTSG